MQLLLFRAGSVKEADSREHAHDFPSDRIPRIPSVRRPSMLAPIPGPFLDPHRMSQSDLVTSAEFIQFAPQHRLNLRPLPHGHGSFRPTFFLVGRLAGCLWAFQ